jgi:hypothetical protein
VTEGPALAVAILLSASVVLALFFWPGSIDADALNQISEARTGRFNDWWAPILDWLWRGLFLLHLSPGFVLWGTLAVFLLSVYELLRVALGRRWAVVGALLITVFPPVLGFLASLQRDTWFGASALAAYALAGRAQRKAGLQRGVAGAGSLIAIWVSLAARQNALVAVIPAAFIATRVLLLRWLPLDGPTRRPSRRGVGSLFRRASLVTVAASVVLLGMFVLSQRVLTYSVIGSMRTYPQQQLLEGDLASLSLREDTDLLPKTVFPAQNLKTLRKYYSPFGSLPLVSGPGHPLVASNPHMQGPGIVDAKGARELKHDWNKAVLAHPRAYLHARWQTWTRLIGWSGNTFEPYHPGFDPNPWGYKAKFPSLNRFGLAFLSSFSSGPLMGGALHRTWVYLLGAVLLTVDLLRPKRSPPLRLLGWLCGAAAAYYLTFFFLATGPNFRWGWLLVAATLIGTGVNLADHTKRWIDTRVDAMVAARAASLPLPAIPTDGPALAGARVAGG